MSKVTLEDAAIELEDAPLAQPELAALVRAADEVVKEAERALADGAIYDGLGRAALRQTIADFHKIERGE